MALLALATVKVGRGKVPFVVLSKPFTCTGAASYVCPPNIRLLFNSLVPA